MTKKAPLFSFKYLLHDMFKWFMSWKCLLFWRIKAYYDGEEAKKAREMLTSLSEYFLYVARDNDKVTNDAEFELISGNVEESEKLYRQHVVLYNADVLGYNFWISFFPTKFIYIILKFKAKDIIN